MNELPKMNEVEDIIARLIMLETKMTKSTMDRGNPAKTDAKKQMVLLNKLSKLIDVNADTIYKNIK